MREWPLTAALCLLLSATGQGQQLESAICLPGQGSSAKSLVVGSEYKSLDLWTRIRMGGAYYTSPELVKNYSFAYSYNIKDFETPERKSEIFKLASRRELGFGIPVGASGKSGDLVKIADLNELAQLYSIDNEDKLTDCLLKNNISLISPSSKLLDKESSDVLAKADFSSGKE